MERGPWAVDDDDGEHGRWSCPYSPTTTSPTPHGEALCAARCWRAVCGFTTAAGLPGATHVPFFPDHCQALEKVRWRRRGAFRHLLDRTTQALQRHPTTLMPVSATMMNLCDCERALKPVACTSKGQQHLPAGSRNEA
jgi:hypothetical protein